MKTSSFDTLCDSLSNNMTVVTPNARLALTLTRRYNALQKKAAWASPTILPLSSWLKTIWREALFLSTEPLFPLLSEEEENILWRKIIQEKITNGYALDTFTQQIKSAWTHCINWQMTIDKSRFSYNEETLFFYDCVQAFNKATQYHQPQTSLMTQLLGLIDKNHLRVPKSLTLAYFDEHTPLQTAFFNQLEQKGTNITHFDERMTVNQVARVDFMDQNEESLALVNWLNNELATGKKNIAVVVPELQARRHSLSRTLYSHIDKEHINFSMGQPLPSFPLVTQALALLNMKQGILSLPALHLVLFSPFIKMGDTPMPVRVKIYHQLKAQGEKEIALSHLISLLKESSFAQTLTQFNTINTTGKHPASHWQILFNDIFEILGFPGDETLSSEEYQTLAKFYDVCDSLVILDKALEAISFETALHWLTWRLTNTLFQPESKQEEIQVLGLLEALGLQFDAMWVMGLNDNKFPKPTEPSPFIPHHLQKQHNMPHATIEREYQFAQNTLSRLTQSADKVILSSYQKEIDAVIEPSPLIMTYPLITLNPKSLPPKPSLEEYTPDYKIPALHATHMKGGTFILKEQARCPFRAYARFRLNINDPREPTEGLDELDRGILVHEVLEAFWREIKTQEALLSLSDAACQTIMETAIDNALKKQEKQHPLTITQDFKALEKKRLKALLSKWLEIEAQRPSFNVTDIESKQSITLGPLAINMRMDRVDTLASGEKIIIDYKTGDPSLSGWFQERMDEPQLPLYSLVDEDIKGLAFASLKSQVLKFKGISEDDMEIKGIKAIKAFKEDSFDALREKWRERLEAIAIEYTDGHITPQPMTNTLCQQCCFKSLCGKNR